MKQNQVQKDKMTKPRERKRENPGFLMSCGCFAMKSSRNLSKELSFPLCTVKILVQRPEVFVWTQNSLYKK